MSQEQEVELGKALDRQIRATVRVYGGSTRLAGLTRRVGHRLAQKSERPDLPWKFRLLDDAAVNAFALPGGIVYITRGLVGHLNSEAELAAVLSHEIAHITALHGSIAIREQEREQRWGGEAGSDFDLSQVAGGRRELELLAHSRERELEADRLALRYLSRAGYPPEAMAGVISLLARLDVRSGKVPAWSRTHPAPRVRARELESRLESDGAPLPLDNEFVGALEGFVFGTDPRNGRLEGSKYRHGRTGFAVDLPPTWATTLVPPAAFAATADGAIQLAVAPRFFTAPTVQHVLSAFSTSERLVLYDQHEYTVGGLPVTRARFRSRDEPAIAGMFQLAQSSDGVITIIAVGPESNWAAHERAVVTTLNSQRLLSEADYVALQPATIAVVSAEQGQTLRTIAADPQELPILRRLNRVSADEVLEEGRLIKRVPAAIESVPPSTVDGADLGTGPSQRPTAAPFFSEVARSAVDRP